MPVYTYKREDGTTFDIKQKFSEDALTTCPTTGQSVTRVIQPAGIVFKGSGFYVNDSKGAKPNLSSTSSKETAEAKTETKSEGTAEAKTETKSEVKSDAAD